MDTFVDSSWYFLRYLNPNDDTMAFDPAEAEKWAPIDQYVGGVEHAILHLLYARFITKVLFDLGYVSFTEPFSAVLNQGSVLLDGKAMSKSRGNLVEFASELDTHGADALRLTMAFAGPPEDNIDWADVSPSGSSKFLARAWRISGEVTSKPEVEWKGGDLALRRQTHHLLADAPGLMEAFKFNVVVARLMELVNTIRKTIDTGPGAGDPVGARGDRGRHGAAVDVRAAHGRGHVGAPRLRGLGLGRAAAQARRDPARRGVGDLDLPGRRQGARQGRGLADDRRRRARGARPGVRRRRARRRRPRDRQRHRARPARRQHRNEEADPMAALTCPRDDGGRLTPIMGAPSNPRPGKPAAHAPVLTGYRCTKGHTVALNELPEDDEK